MRLMRPIWPMRAPFWMKLALCEARASARRLGVYMAAITLGVAALVAINSFRAQVVDSVDAESRALLGADARLGSNRAFPDSVQAVLDSAAAAGVQIARVVTTLSVALSQEGAPRLVQLRAVDGGYPFYGTMVTEPAGEWERLGTGRGALLEAPLLEQLAVSAGDSIRLGAIWFEVRGALTSLPPEISFRTALGHRVYISGQHLEATGLLRFGALARHEAFLRIPDHTELQRFIDRNHDTFRRAAVSFDTAADQAENLAEALEALGRFLGLVGLSALLLGGLGVASAVNVFVKDKRRTVAVLRCLGATQGTAFGAYMAQATALGTIGAAIGAVLGIGIQAILPRLAGDLIPIDVPFSVQWPVVLIGLGIGAVVAATFALLPLLAIRGISPLQALRHDVDTGRRRSIDVWQVLAAAIIIASVAAVAVWQARLWQVGLAYAAGLIAGLAILWTCAWLLGGIARRVTSTATRTAAAAGTGAVRRRAFTIRQGIANLHRPRNQTTAVTMAVGFGVFLVATLWVVQVNLLGWLQNDAGGPRPNLVFFDIQIDQTDEIREILTRYAGAPPTLVPIVPARIAAINGIEVDELLGQRRAPRVEPWAVRRDYRHTYRSQLTGAESLVAGDWFDRAPPAEPGVLRVSAEEDVARSLGVGIGDRITWDITGIRVESVITSLRQVEWARFETNFFFVFEPGGLDAAPQTLVSLVRVPDDAARTAAQRAVAERFANISVVDLATVQRMLQRIVDRVIYAIRFMAAFSVATGALVLVGAIAASRFQRVQESALLRALGATRRQIRDILLVEYAALGTLAALTGVLLAALAGWLIMRFVFHMPFTMPAAALVTIWAAVTAAAAVLGMLNSREAVRSTPLAALREAES
jgi:putative ABC transport system permease protein